MPARVRAGETRLRSIFTERTQLRTFVMFHYSLERRDSADKARFLGNETNEGFL